MTTLSVEQLYALKADDLPGWIREVFSAVLEQSPVVAAFFSGQGYVSTISPAMALVDASWRDDVAAAMMCSAISRSSLHGFAGTVSQPAADGWWQGQLAGGQGLQSSQRLVEWAFPSHCSNGGGVTLQDYLAQDSAGWGARLADLLTSPRFVNVEINRLIASDPNWLAKLNLAYYKLHRLDPGQEGRVVEAWSGVNSAAVAQWQTYNYLSGAYAPDRWLGAANKLIGEGTDEVLWMPGMRGVMTAVHTTTYGKRVQDFLGGRPKALGLTTGKDAGQSKDHSGGGGGCFIGETPVHLHDGSTIPIKKIGGGHRLLARHGVHAIHTDERVVVTPHASIPIYGFNDHEPFFTAGHLFWTPQGWKAFEPEIARYENPSREVGQLEIGDVVLRLRDEDHEGTEYEEVIIEKFTMKILAEGETVHGVHLDGANTYHVHGYLVGANYPMITAQRLMDGFATLTAQERQLIGEVLTPVMPLLRKAVGRFIEAPIHRAIEQTAIDEGESA